MLKQRRKTLYRSACYMFFRSQEGLAHSTIEEMIWENVFLGEKRKNVTSPLPPQPPPSPLFFGKTHPYLQKSVQNGRKTAKACKKKTYGFQPLAQTCMYVCMHVCMYACMYVCMYELCMYVYIIYSNIVCVCIYNCLYIFCVCVCLCLCVCMYVILYVYHVHLAHEYPAGPEMVRGVDIGKPWKTCPCPCLFRDVFKKWAIHAGNSVNLAVARSVSFHSQQFLAVCAQESPSKHPSIQGMLSLLACKFWGTQRFIFFKMLSIVPIRSGEKL